MINDHQRKLLAKLVAHGGMATSAELGGYSYLGATARTKSKKDGLVTYDRDGKVGGCWHITDIGRAVLLSLPNRER